jgi:hypothetical protein
MVTEETIRSWEEKEFQPVYSLPRWSYRRAECGERAWLQLEDFRSYGDNVCARRSPERSDHLLEHVRNPYEVDLDTFGADVDEYDFKAPANFTRVSHQVKVALTRKRCLNRKALSPLDVLLGQTENLTAGGHS